MRPSFLSKLVNGPLFDPVVHVKILNERTSLLFDCGWFQGLANREVLRLHALFISHMHMDHFIGFDRILRVILHREHPIHVYGPEGSTEKIILKLQAYSWNLTQNYPLDVIIHEVGPTAVITTHASARSGFQVSSMHNRERSSHTIARQGRFHVDAVVLDHNIPTLGFVLREPFHIHILGDVLREKGYRTGTWIGLLKTCILEDRLEEMIPVRMSQGETLCKARTLMHEIVRTSRGQKLVYITDIRFSQTNIDRIKEIALDPDILFVEAYYLHELRERAYEKGHLTAQQAGHLGKELGAKKLVPMHVSPRYHHRMRDILAEISHAMEKD